MKRPAIIISALVVIIIVAVHFSTYKKVEVNTLPIRDIGKGTINYMKINYKGKTIKAPFNPDFVLIQDEKFGDPKGSFTLIKKENIFGFIKYEAVYNKKK